MARTATMGRCYFVQCVHSRRIKIGWTGGRLKRRFGQLQTGSASPLSLILSLPGDRALERRLHERFARHRLRGEWFRPDPELLAFIDQARADHYRLPG